MSKDSIKSSKEKSDIINLIAISFVSLICIAFFAAACFYFNSSLSEITILDLKQSGSTDNSVLLSWNCSVKPDRYMVKYTIDGETKYLESQLPFARIGGLDPEQTLDVDVFPIKNDVYYLSQSIKCTTQSRCDVKNISAQCVDNSINLSWSFKGADMGFEVAAYVLDINGYRHLTSEIIDIAPGNPSECTIDDIMPGMNYTVTVVPKCKYFKTEKLTVEGSEYSKLYDGLNIIRFGICSTSQNNSKNVKILKSITSNQSYTISILLNGQADADSTSNFSLYFINSSGDLAKELKYADIHTNPDDLKSYMERTFNLNFTADIPADKYTAILCIDGKPASQINFEVIA